MLFGVQWLSTLGDILWNFKRLQMKFVLNKDLVVLQGTEISEVQAITEEQREKLLSKPITSNMIQAFNIQVTIAANSIHSIQAFTSVSTEEPDSLHPRLAAVIEEFQHLFEEPNSLPRHRGQDHRIQLKEGSQPPISDLIRIQVCRKM